MKSEPLIGGFFVLFVAGALLIVSTNKDTEPPPNKLQAEVESLRDDLNQLTVVVSELEPVIVVNGEVADETFDWNEFHNVPTKGQ
jgi:hypothetical protein